MPPQDGMHILFTPGQEEDKPGYIDGTGHLQRRGSPARGAPLLVLALLSAHTWPSGEGGSRAPTRANDGGGTDHVLGRKLRHVEGRRVLHDLQSEDILAVAYQLRT